MVVEDTLTSIKEDDSQFFVVLFSTNEEVKSSQLLRFTKEKASWTIDSPKDCITHPDNYEAKFVNGFRVTDD